MSDIDIKTIEALRKLQEKQIPDPQEEYNLFPEGEPVHRVAIPTYKQVKQAEECRLKRPRQDKEVIEQVAGDYGWSVDDFPAFDTQFDYYKAIIPIVALEEVKVSEDFSPMEADRMIKDFFTCAFY
jgi:hypothetical protein